MAGNYVIVANFCDRAGPFLKFEKNFHMAARKLRFQFCQGYVPLTLDVMRVAFKVPLAFHTPL